MKKMILAAVAALSLATGAAAFAQPGSNAASHPGYYTYADTDHRSYPPVHFLGQGTVFAKIFCHSNGGQANKTDATPAKGS